MKKPQRRRTFLRAYRFALDPTPLQVDQLRLHCGAQRFAYNWGLRIVKANLNQRAAERSYGIAETDLTPALSWSAFRLRKLWNQVKDEAAPWWAENSKEAYASGLFNLAAALDNWATTRAEGHKGRRKEFPRFKSKKARLACRFNNGAFGLVDTDRRHVKLPRIGKIRTHESTRKLARRVQAGVTRIRSATVTFDRGRWFVSFCVEQEQTSRSSARPGSVVGVDLGILHFAVASEPVPGITDGEGKVANPRRLEHAQRSLRRLQRQGARRRGPDKRTLTEPSKRWERTQSQVRRLHTRIANGRSDRLHQLTGALTRRFGTIVIEDLNVAGMMSNHRLARRIADASWAEFRRQLNYKATWRGNELIVAPRFYASSKKCSACGAVKDKLRLSERTYWCGSCGTTMDRDLNAARNLAALAREVAEGGSSPSCGATENEPDGNLCKTSLAGDGYCHGKPPGGNAA